MARRHKVDEIHLEVTGFVPFRNGRGAGFVIEWSSDIGFGEYTVYKNHNEDKWYGDSEHMDRDEDKDFIRELMKLFIDKLIIDD